MVTAISLQRDTSLDTLRGLMLVTIGINHFGGFLKQHVYQPIGYVTAAEGFVILSGIVFGLVYSRYLVGGGGHLTRRSFRRAGVIYKYHLAVFYTVCCMMIVEKTVFSAQLDITRLFTPEPLHGLLLAPFLLFQPPFLDILPMYIWFLIVGPFILRLFACGKAKAVLATSASLWLLAQIDCLWYPLAKLQSATGLNLGYFNICAWQLIFVGGCWIGFKRFQRATLSRFDNKLLLWASLTLAILLYLIRHGWVNIPLLETNDATTPQTLAWLRVLNFAAVVNLIGWLLRRGMVLRVRWLAYLGRYSLQVFSYQVVILYMTWPLRTKLNQTGGWPEMVLCLLFLVSLTLPALWAAHQDTRAASLVTRPRISSTAPRRTR